MFKSIKTRIIFTVIALFLIGSGIMTYLSGMQVKNKTEESVIDQSTVLIEETSTFYHELPGTIQQRDLSAFCYNERTRLSSGK